jgi:Fur family ferric uptake transcriptional regulator
MVCLTTGKVVEFEDEMIEKRQEKVAAQKGYRIVDHTLVLYVEPLEK